ncbi:MAG: alpha/beta fold hydrolase [Chloroflexi bacterium]|nr:alpha/beta fold hydrolase [Chloroflexota bacterium]
MTDLTNETFGGTWPYQPRFFEHEGVRLHYVDEGEGEPIVMLHGNPTWGYLYRNFIPALSESNRCVVPDYMGFGKSDKPLEQPYTLARHIENFSALMLDLDLRDVTLVMQDWGGPIGLGFGVEHPERIKRLVILNTWAFRIPEGSPLAPLLELFRQPHVGEAMVQGLNLFVEGFLPAGIYHKERLEQFMPAYRAPFPDWNSRIGTLAFPRDIPVGDEHPSTAAMGHIQDNLGKLNVPTTIIWALQDPAIPPALIDAWKGVYPHADEHRIETASHFLQEDEPEQIVGLIQEFLKNNP